MGKVFFSVTVSLDGYVAPDRVSDEQWLKQWLSLQDYVLHQKFFRTNLKFGDDGETGIDNQILQQTFERTGCTVIGKRMFDGGERSWPEEAPFHTPVMVLTHQKREPWVRPGGTTFHFINDGIQRALTMAKEAAGARDVRIGGGGHTLLQFLNAGLVDEFHLAVSPMFMGAGIRLFDRIDTQQVKVVPQRVEVSKRVSHLFYSVTKA